MTKPENPLKRADGTMIDGKECEAFPLSSQKFQQVSSVEPEELKFQPDEATILSIGDVQIEKEDNGADTDNKSAEDSPGASGNETTEKLPDGSSVEPSESSPKASGTAITEAEKVVIDRVKEIIAELKELEKAKQELDWKIEQKVKREEKKKQKKDEMQKKEEKRLNKNKKKKKKK